MLIVCSLALATLAQDVHTVHPDGDADFTSIQAAVQAAADGDTIVVHVPDDPFALRDGFTIDGKGLTLHALASAPLTDDGVTTEHLLVGPVVVQNTLAGQDVVLSGFQMNAPEDLGQPTGVPGSGLAVLNCAGSVRVQSCFVRGPASAPQLPALAADLALDLTVVDSEVRAHGQNSFGASPAQPGVIATRSRLAFYRTTVRGNDGQAEYSVNGAASGRDGGAAVILEQRSFLWLGRSDVRGGDGGLASCSFDNGGCFTTGGDGGAGVVVAPGCLFVHLQSSVAGGGGGGASGSWIGNNFPGSAGADVVGHGLEVPGEHRDLATGPRSRSGVAHSVRVTGAPGERALAFVGRGGAHRYFGWQWGSLLVSDLVAGGPVDLGPIPASGILDAQLALPSVDPQAIEAFQVQVACKTSPSRFRMTPVATVLVLGDEVPCMDCGETIFVDATAAPGGSGRTWANARSDLRATLRSLPWCGASTPENSVWVAAGTYRPGAPGDARTQRFAARSGLHLLGGFAGGEASASERDPRANVATLDADLNGDDGPGNGRDDNTHTLVSGGTPDDNVYLTGLVVDGFTLRGTQGGPAISATGQVVLRNCLLHDNHGGAAGGLDFGSPLVERWKRMQLDVIHCRFVGNTGTVSGAAQIQLRAESGGQPPVRPEVQIVNSSFVGNYAEDLSVPVSWSLAGAVFFGASWNLTPLFEVRSCTFYANAGLRCNAGAMRGAGSYDAVLTNNIFWGNHCDSDVHERELSGFYPSQDVYRHNCIRTPFAFELGPGGTSLSPVFVDPRGPDGVGGTLDDDLTLALTSTLVDAGHNPSVPTWLTVDLHGRPRIADEPAAPNTGVGGPPTVDIGAYER